MTAPDVVLIDGAPSIGAVRELIASSSLAEAFENDYVNEPGLDDLESYEFLVDVRGTGQADEAHRIVDAATARGWATLWLRGSRVVERHQAPA